MKCPGIDHHGKTELFGTDQWEIQKYSGTLFGKFQKTALLRITGRQRHPVFLYGADLITLTLSALPAVHDLLKLRYAQPRSQLSLFASGIKHRFPQIRQPVHQFHTFYFAGKQQYIEDRIL